MHLVPCVLVAGGKLSMCVDGLLQFFFFGPSAVAKLWIKTQTVIPPFLLKGNYKFGSHSERKKMLWLLFHKYRTSHCSLLHEAAQELVDVCASLQEVFGRLLRLLLCLVSCNF